MAKAKIKKSGRRLPAFLDDAEDREFWETHKPGEYVARTHPARVEVSKEFSARVKARGRRLRRKRVG